MERRRRTGGYAGFGSPEFGQRAVGGALVDDPKEQEAVALVAKLRAQMTPSLGNR